MDESNENIDYIDPTTTEQKEKLQLYYNKLTGFLQQSDDIKILLSASANFKNNHNSKYIKPILK